jgi:translation initiation factor IF-2
MPAARTGPPPARRTTYDPRAAAAPARPGTTGFGPAGRPMMNQRGRPGFRPRPGQGGAGPMSRKPASVSTQEMASHKKVIKIEEQVSLQQLAVKMSVKATDVLMRLLSMGMTGVNINSTLDADTAKILASEFGWAVEDVAVSEADTLTAAMGVDAEAATTEHELRPPIVTVMGHVDHGKTSLLDRIRKSTVAEGEAGGITQHVGAYRVETPRGTVAFLDTPGHEAFTAMRARGASLTDIVVLVVAADDGVMPQTREAIAHAQAAKVPIIVAINKIDKPGADPEKITRELSSLGLQPEEWGGETIFVHVSAKTGQNIDHLLESILLQAEVLELKANPKRRASGTVIEALLDRGRGPVARVMVQDGTLRTGDILLAGGAWGKVRAMTDELGRAVGEAGPATPVEVLGLNEVPSAGDPVHAVKDAKTAEEIAETRRKKTSKTLIPQDSRVSLEALTTRLSEADQLELKLIVKGDVQGSVEAVGHALSKLSAQKVKVTLVHAAVGGITEGDVNLAVASKAIIVGFNVRPTGKAASLAESEGVEIRLYNIIYNAVDDIRSAMEGLLPATKVEKALGRAEVRQVFRIQKVGTVAGCIVSSGMMRRTAEARLVRDSVVVWTGRLSGLRRFKDDVKEVSEGFECGISLENYQDIKEGDSIESFEIEEVKTKLT